MVSKSVKLTVDGQLVELAIFVQSYFEQVINAIISTLDTHTPVETIAIEANENSLILQVNHEAVSLTPFVSLIVHNTVKGMVKSLRGVSSVDVFCIDISKE